MNISEEDREPGFGKFGRALTRRYAADPEGRHPFDEEVNPSVLTGGARKMRDLLGGRTQLTDYQRETYEGYASESSADDDDYYVRRKRLAWDSERRSRKGQ